VCKGRTLHKNVMSGVEQVAAKGTPRGTVAKTAPADKSCVKLARAQVELDKGGVGGGGAEVRLVGRRERVVKGE